MRPILWPVVLIFTIALLLLPIGLSWAVTEEAPGSALALALAFLLPIGLTLVAWSALPPDRSDQVAALATLALALALLGYFATGFAFQYGGVASISRIEGLQHLSRFFSLVRGPDSATWGIVGLTGFFLDGDGSTSAALELFLTQLPLVTSAVLIVLLSFPRHTPRLAQLTVGLLTSALIYPLAGHWVNGGGWLARLGHSLAMGHGLVDFAGSGTLFLLSGAIALSAAVVFNRNKSAAEAHSNAVPVMQPPQFPLLAALGAPLAAVGWIAMTLANPLYAEAAGALNWPLIIVNGLSGLAAGTISAQLYSWFATGRFDPLMGPRGALAGLAAISAGAPFVPTWAALVIGGVAGLLLPLMMYAIERLFGTRNAGAAVASYGLPGLWGLLAVALFANARWGQGWNGTGGAPGQGVAGLIVPAGAQVDAGQLAAQIWGGIALFILGFIIPWAVFTLAAALSRLRVPRRKQVIAPEEAAAEGLPPPGEHQGALRGFDRAVNLDDRG